MLGENEGLLLYDDDLLTTVEVLTRLPPSEADALRRRLTDPEDSSGAKAAFLAACDKAGVRRPAAE